MNGNCPAYSDSLESGVKWIGEVPTHWSPLKFKRVLSEKKHTPNPTLPAGSISFGRVVYKNSETLAEATKASYQEVMPDEFLVNPLNLNFDLKSLRTALSDIAVVVSTGYIVLRSSTRLNKRFTRWLLQEFDVAHMKTLGAGVRQTINFTDIGNSIFFAPPLEEQTQIAKFLDYETAKIDALIEKQQELIALLKEKRQAVISHAVTKGLNPDAPMRDSDVEWLGEVPAHWEVDKLYHLTSRIGDGLHGTPSYQDGTGLYFVNGNNLEDGRIVIGDSAKEVPPSEYHRHHISMSRSTVLLSINGTIGKVAIYADERVILGKSAAYINCLGKLKPSFLQIFFQSHNAHRYYELVSTGTTISNLSLDSIRQLKIGLPDLEEQEAIVEFCTAQSEKYDDLITVASTIAEKLQERRTALISAAVTGKIDVRNWKAPETEKEAEVA